MKDYIKAFIEATDDGTMNRDELEEFVNDSLFDQFGDVSDIVSKIMEERKMRKIYTADREERQEALAGELSEMFALGWTDEEARENEEAFFERIGDYANGLTEEEIWEVWQNVLDIHEEQETLLGIKK